MASAVSSFWEQSSSTSDVSPLSDRVVSWLFAQFSVSSTLFPVTDSVVSWLPEQSRSVRF